MFPVSRQCLDGRIGKEAPAQLLVTVCHVGSNRERSIKQQYTLFGPACQVSIGRHRLAKVIVNLLKNIDERRGHHHTFRHGETQSHGLTRLVIRILTDDDNLHLVKRREVESIEDKMSGRIARPMLIFLSDGIGKLLEIRSLKLRLKILFPGWFYLYIHKLCSKYLHAK